MILDEIVLHDFGIYGGRQSVRLTPQPRRPVILFGGLNGRGKTTLLDAFQLCLYGSAAQLSNRNGQSYEEYLRKSIHHAAGRSGASIELSFRNRVNGAEQSFRLIRSWVATKSSVREHFEVVRDGKFDRLATDHWASQVEDFIPSRIAHLFLFDGEKVEGYADLEAAPTLIATAIQNLLGLDIVERLTTDLISLERRHRGAVRPPEEQKQLEQLREDIRIVNAAKASIVQARAAAGNALDRVRRKAEDLEEQYRREGGTLYEERAAKEASLASVERDLERVRRELREVVTGSAPLLLVPTLLKTLQKRDADEEVGRAASESLRTLLEEHEALLAHPVVAQLPRAKRDALSQAMADRRRARESKIGEPAVIKLEAGARADLHALTAVELPTLQASLNALLKEEAKLVRCLNEFRSEVAAIPSHEMIAGLEAKRAEARTELALAEANYAAKSDELMRIEAELGALRQREERLQAEEAKARFVQEDTVRMLRHSERVRSTMGQFREAVVVRHVERIQALVLDSFRQLARKEQLICALKIDPVTFDLDLTGADGRSLSAERLSAGERQLLAIAILWGLARAAGRPLPTVIDTPLGRLDSGHRDHLVRRYFPQASHQVLLLSTDEEIAGRYYDALKPAIGREYRLRFDEIEARTIIEEGYFGGSAHAH